MHFSEEWKTDERRAAAALEGSGKPCLLDSGEQFLSGLWAEKKKRMAFFFRQFCQGRAADWRTLAPPSPPMEASPLVGRNAFMAFRAPSL